MFQDLALNKLEFVLIFNKHGVNNVVGNLSFKILLTKSILSFVVITLDPGK